MFLRLAVTPKGGSMHAPPRHSRTRVVRRFVPALLVAAVMVTAITAGPLPNLLDDNRGNIGLAVIETAAFNGALAALAPIFLNPVSPAFSYPPAIISGRVLEHPKIHNLYLDSDWDAHNPDAPTRGQIDALTQALVNSGYFAEASQYGVGSASFTGSHDRSLLCAPFEPIAGHAELAIAIAVQAELQVLAE